MMFELFVILEQCIGLNDTTAHSYGRGIICTCPYARLTECLCHTPGKTPSYHVVPLFQRSRCAVPMCGYNTAIDLLLTGTPGVLVPFDAGGEQEQTLRARSLSERSAYTLLLACLLYTSPSPRD